VYWTVAQLQPHHERLALHCLALHGFTAYLPRLRPPRKRGRRDPTPQPLFPNYAFVRITLHWSGAHWCEGVSKLLMSGEQPARVPDAVIDGIRAHERNGLVVLPRASRLKPGDQVRVVAGLLEGQLGVLVGLRGQARAEVLLTMLGRMTLPMADIERV
jgi:transcription antitermination factor NusG